MKFDIDNFRLDKVGSDTLFIAADFCNEDISVLIVGRKHGEKVEIINQLSGNQALAAYLLLVGDRRFND